MREFISKPDIQSNSKKNGLFPIIFFFLRQTLEFIMYKPLVNLINGFKKSLDTEDFSKSKFRKMAKKITPKPETEILAQEKLLLDERKVKALEKMANVLDALTLWFEDIDKTEWSERTQWYLAEMHNKYLKEDK